MFRTILPLLTCMLMFLSASSTRAECPHGQRMDHLVKIPRGQIPMQELWNMGADDMGVVDDRVLVRLSPQMLEQLKNRGIPYEVVYEDIDQAYEEYRRNRAVTHAEPFFDYHDYDSAVAVMERIADENPEIAALELIGESVEGRPIYVLRISDNAQEIEDDEPAILVDGCHHAREWISVEVPLFFADYLVDNYGRNGDITRLLNYAEVWIAPILNPDGYVYSDEEDRWWRKNRRVNGDGTIGVDCNRNYSIGWGDDLGSSSETFSEVYRGTAPFSEPETRAVRDLMDGTWGRSFEAYLSYHNYSQLVMYPNGYTYDSVDNRDFYDSLAAEMVERINASHGSSLHDYSYGPVSEVLYAVSGGSIDWAHHAIGAISFTIEVRPAGPPFFELPPEEIIPTCIENFPAFMHLAEQTLIPTLRAIDTDLDGFANADDYCINSPSAEVDDIGCGPTEQDVDLDGVMNREDACRDSLPSQQVKVDGCRVEPLFGIEIISNVQAVDISVNPPDIDALGTGEATTAGFRREYAQATTVEVTASLVSNGNRFVHWIVNGVDQPTGELTVILDQSTNISVEAVYIYPASVEIVGPRRLPDRGTEGTNFLVQYSAQVLYNDGSLFPVDNIDSWGITDSHIASITQQGQLLAYDVSADESEVRTTLTATVQFAGRQLAARPLQVSVYDRATVAPRCWRLSIEGDDAVESRSSASFRAQVWMDGEFEPQDQTTSVEWYVRAAESATSLPASVSATGVLSTSRISEDTDVVLRAVLVNDDASACIAEKTVRVATRQTEGSAAQDLAGESSNSTCGSMGMIPLFISLMGLYAFRPTRRNFSKRNM